MSNRRAQLHRGTRVDGQDPHDIEGGRRGDLRHRFPLGSGSQCTYCAAAPV